MNILCVKAEHLSKKFFIPAGARSTLNLIRAMCSRHSLGKELWALSDIHFEIEQGEKIAVIGPNGSGKTTLLRIISDIYVPTAGSIILTQTPRPLFNVSSGLHNELSVIDNMFLFGAIHGISREYIKDHSNEIINQAGLQDMCYVLMKDLSRGQRQRLALSVFFRVSESFLIFDESFTCVDQSFFSCCQVYFEQLARSSKTVVMVSHDMNFLLKFCAKALWLEQGRIRMFGEIGRVISEYQRSRSPA